MEFHGPHRELLARIYRRCEERGWFGPESEDPHRRENDELIFYGHLSEEDIRRATPFLTELNYRYAVDRGHHTTIIDLSSDVRRHHFFYSPATAEQIAHSEKIIGFPLPTILRDIYTLLANGGFGMQSGIVGIVGGAESNLYTIDQGTTHASWKLTDRVPDGLVGRQDVCKCFELPDRFIPLCHRGCSVESWIDGWTGHVYLIDAYNTFDDEPPHNYDEGYEWCDSDEESTEPEMLGGPENQWPLEMSENVDWEWVDVDVNAVVDDSVPSSCLGIRYEAWSVEELLEKWLNTPKKNSVN